MSLSPSTKFGAFGTTGMFCKGDMGEVYHATASKLGRGVAIKVLPYALAVYMKH